MKNGTSSLHELVDPILDRYRRWKASLYQKERSEASRDLFRIIDIELTNKCPMSCVMCPRTNNMMREQGLMDFKLFKKIVDEYVAVNPAVATGCDIFLHHFGESLAHPEFGRFVRYASSLGMRPCLSINPIMLKPDVMSELIDCAPTEILVALDGHDDESFEKIRGVKNAYEKSKANLMEYLRLKKEKGSKTRVLLSMIDFSLNKDSIAQLRRHWEAVPGIDQFLCKPFITWNGDAQDVNLLAGGLEDRNAEFRAQGRAVTCRKPWEEMSVTWDGELIACCFDYDKKYPLGSARERSLLEIWNGERMRALRSEFIRGQVDNPLCRNCAYLYAGVSLYDAVRSRLVPDSVA